MMWMDAAIKAGMAGAVGYVTYKLIEEYGPGIADLLIDLHTNPEVERQPDEAAGHVPIRPAPILPPTGSNSIADDILERNPTLNRLDVEAIVLECRDLAVRAGLVAIDSAGGSYHPCRNLPIFVPGSDLGEVAEHKQRAIHRMPWSFQLTNATRSEMNDQLVAQGYSLALWSPWYTRVPADHPTYLTDSTPCEFPAPSIDFECDEYPYGASEQAGPDSAGDPGNPSTWRGFSLHQVPTLLNGHEGTLLGTFKMNCGLVGATSRGKPFLVVPMPQAMPTQTTICGTP